MGFELDPFDDVFGDNAPKNPRAGGKFQPKFKPQPRKGPSKSAQPIQPVNNNGDDQPISLSTIDTHSITLQSSAVNDNPSSEPAVVAPREETVDPVDGVNHENNEDWGPSVGKSGTENPDLYFRLDSLDDILSQSANANVNSPSRSQTKVHIAAEPKNERPTSSSVNTDAEASPVDESASLVSSASLADKDPSTGIDATVSTIVGDFQANNSTIGTEEVEAFRCWDDLDFTSELITNSGQKAGKFQPKPKLRTENGNEKENACSPTIDLNLPETVTYELDAQSVPSGAEYMEHGTIPALSPDEEHMEAAPLVPGKNVSQRSKSGKRKKTTASDLPMEHQKDSISGQENATGRSTRQLRKRINEHEPTIEYEDEVHGNGDSSEEHPSDLVGNEEVQNDIEYQVETNPKNKRGPRKSVKPVAEKEPVTEKEKPAPKRGRKAKDIPDQSNKKPRKKFPHSTRRNKRQVDKALLEIPEHLVDPQKLRIRDLILLAEHQERISKKEAAASGTPLTNQSGGHSFTHLSGVDTYATEQVEGSDDEQMSPKVQESSPYFNYQTYMDKTPTTRWSKQDTELFYEAVRQFGTDFSLIQQLFPDRTRNQVKFKFKKEERENPLRFQEALTTPTADLTQFEKVLERLEEIAAQEKQENDDLNDYEDEVEELAPETNKKEAEKTEEPQKEEQEEEAPIPMKDDDDNNEDDSYRWSQYISEF